MKSKGKPDSKIPAVKPGINKKKTFEAKDGGAKFDASLLKKNEFVLIAIGALLLTMIVFFLFFRSPAPKVGPAENRVSASSFAEMENRIKTIETALQIKRDKGGPAGDEIVNQGSRINSIKDRVARLETAFAVKFDFLIERMGKIEKNISNLQNKSVSAMAVKQKPKGIAPVKKAVKKVIKKEKKKSMFHTVKKGETLYSISKKYKTSIAALLKLNHLTTKTKIYPGDNLLVR